MIIIQSIKSIFLFLRYGGSILFTLFILGTIEVGVVSHHPFVELFEKTAFFTPNQIEIVKRISWNVIQLIPAFSFGALADTYMRKKILVIVQICGVFFSIAYLFVNNETLKILALFFLVLTFNPLSIIRAYFLDNFSKMSAILIMALTYIIRNLPWQFVGFLKPVSLEKILTVSAIFLVINVIFTIRFHKEKYNTKEGLEKLEILHKKQQENFKQKNRWSIRGAYFSLGLAESTFCLIWIILEEGGALSNWLMLTSFVTFIAMIVITLYQRIPRLSLISDIYSVLGIATMLSFLTAVFFVPSMITLSLIVTMLMNCIGGGFYLPLATDGLIELCGIGRRAVGAAYSESSEAIGLAIAGGASIFVWKHPSFIFGTIAFFYILAALIQVLSLKKATLNIQRVHL